METAIGHIRAPRSRQFPCTEDRWMPLRVARYVVRIWEREMERDPGASSLPAVIPIVVQGPRPWQRTTDLGELVHAPAALDDLRPRLRFVLDGLGALSDAALLARPIPPWAAQVGRRRSIAWSRLS